MTGQKIKATVELEILVAGMDEHRPACRGDDRFTADREQVTDADLTAMKTICDTCPLLAQCAAYAAADKPSAGLWAGRYWGPKQRREKP